MELEANFGLFDLVREAKAKIETLVMAEGSRSVIYFMEFNRLSWFVARSSMSPRSLASTSDGSTRLRHFQINL